MNSFLLVVISIFHFVHTNESDPMSAVKKLPLHNTDIKMWDITTHYMRWYDSEPYTVMLYMEAKAIGLEKAVLKGESSTLTWLILTAYTVITNDSEKCSAYISRMVFRS